MAESLKRVASSRLIINGHRESCLRPSR